ncbi:pantoate--beta-alanine ligase [Phenylobacterium immobile]|uniref:pantoate--beta-alanine ligase n=1 Tax=Phenylobacterium immobile TaxID=21 RepID=UPI000AA2795E|nr:pantoate--beta-alanine ligase [Phenylobacterium immobile]
MSESPLPIPVARTVAQVRETVHAWRAGGERVALVPTMGALHAGHISLITLARTQAERVVASVFVNPTQFGPNEDFAAYPRDEAGDAAKLAEAGCDLMFAPTVEEVYPAGAATIVHVSGVSEPLDGAARPGHFDGVATVVSKLFNMVGPDVAVFGEKDYQQLQVIRRFTADLNLPVEIVGAPTLRAEDGLALSSRNAYLTAAERAVAPALQQTLRRAAERLRAGDRVDEVETEALGTLRAAGFGPVDYVEARGAGDLARLGPGPLGGEPARLLAAARLGRTRLIDNLAV